jgi:hypothetical protein
MQVWRSRQHTCECCNEPLLEPRLYNFHHILEKREKLFQHVDYSIYRHCLWNILLLCWGCHDAYERMPDTRPFIVGVKQGLLTLMEQPFDYDQHIIWPQAAPVEFNLLHSLFGNLPIQLE